jgi:hypothetical protein
MERRSSGNGASADLSQIDLSVSRKLVEVGSANPDRG